MKTFFLITPYGRNDPDAPRLEREIYQQLNWLYENMFRPAEELCRARGVNLKISDDRDLPRIEDATEIKRRTSRNIDQSDGAILVMIADKPNA